MAAAAPANERQLTFSPKGHDLDHNDNFSPDGSILVYDTRETVGPGIEHGETIEKVDIATGVETVLYRPEAIVTGARPAPGIGAVSHSPVAYEVLFIHGPPVTTLGTRGPYGKPNRTGASVPTDGSGTVTWVDHRDIATDRDTLPGAHRGGTHRHEYSADGSRIGFTYDDFLLTNYERSIGYLEPHPDAPEGATHYFALLVPVAPKGTAKAGEIERAWGDSWVGAKGEQRVFIGQVRSANGEDFERAVFMIDVPRSVDITTADAGSATRFPSPPKGVSIRRLTDANTMPGFEPDGILRGSLDGKWIVVTWKPVAAEAGPYEVTVMPAAGGYDISGTAQPLAPAITRLPEQTSTSVRWHPSKNIVFYVDENNGIAAWHVDTGDIDRIVPGDDGPERSRPTVSPDGTQIAYNKAVPTKDAGGNLVQNYEGKDFFQIFIADTGL